MCVILESLEIPNETLCTLDFDCCEGVDGDEVLAKLKDVLQVNLGWKSGWKILHWKELLMNKYVCSQFKACMKCV